MLLPFLVLVVLLTLAAVPVATWVLRVLRTIPSSNDDFACHFDQYTWVSTGPLARSDTLPAVSRTDPATSAS